MQAALQRSVQSSVRESLQASLHAELAEVKRALRAAEEHASIDRKRADARHSSLLSSVEANAAAAKEKVDKTNADASTLLEQAQAQAQAHAKEASARAEAATTEARAAVAARLEAEAAMRERERHLERLRAEHSSIIQKAEEATAAKLAKVTEQAEKSLAESHADAAKQFAAAAAEADAQKRAAAREKAVELSTLARELSKAEAQAGAAHEAGEAAAEARLRPELSKSSEAARDYAREMAELESATSEIAAAKAAVEAERSAVEAEREASRAEVEHWKRLAREQLAAEREALVADMETMRIAAGREAASEALEREAAELLAQREQLAAERLQMDATSLTLSREAAAARTELGQMEESARLSREAMAAQWKALEDERTAIAALLERDRQAYADALHRERESAAKAFAAAEASHVDVAATLRQQLAQATMDASAVGSLRLALASEKEQHEAAVAALNDARSKATHLEHDLSEAGPSGAIMKSLTTELRLVEAELRRSKESEAVALAARSESDHVMRSAFEQLSVEAAAAKGIADERVATVEGEAAYHRETLSRQLHEARSALDVATANLVAEQSAVFALRGMMLVADADVAAMRGAAAHYAALGGEEVGALREAVSRTEVSRREAVEAERRRCDALLDRERDKFDAMLTQLRESSFSVQAKLSSQLAWLSDALDERTRELHAEREGFDVALAKEREATAAAHEASRRVLAEVADRQAARHAAEVSEQGAAMEAQLAVEREAFLEQLVDHKEINAHLADARAEARAAKLELADVRERHKQEAAAWEQETARLRTELQAERDALSDAPRRVGAEAEERHATALARLRHEHERERERDAMSVSSLETQLASITAAIARERELHLAERERWEERLRDLDAKVKAERLNDVRSTTSDLEQQLAEAQQAEEAVRRRLRAVTASAQAEVERGTEQVSELHDARQRQLRLEHTQLAELHAQSSSALKSMADQREALRLEAEAHRRTQESLLQLHETMQKERDSFAMEMAGDRDARVRACIM